MTNNATTNMTPTSKKRGKKGEAILNAYSNVPTTPVDLKQFATENGVSYKTLKQIKRFMLDDNFEPRVDLPGEVKIYTDKETKSLMIFLDTSVSVPYEKYKKPQNVTKTSTSTSSTSSLSSQTSIFSQDDVTTTVDIDDEVQSDVS